MHSSPPATTARALAHKCGSIPAASSLMESARREAMAESRRGIRAFLPSPPVWLDQVHGSDVAIVERLVFVGGAAAPTPRGCGGHARDPTSCSPCASPIACPCCSAIAPAPSSASRTPAGADSPPACSSAPLRRWRCDPADVVAWLGPAIGTAAFEVGDDVRDAFVGPDSGADAAFSRGRRRQVARRSRMRSRGGGSRARA